MSIEILGPNSRPKSLLTDSVADGWSWASVLTPDQITAIAPDAASLKAGRDLATPRKWVSAGGDEEVLWGLAMGSGKDPYQCRVALADLASKCSCPSRKFPCKHALGLMQLSVSQPAALTEKDRPAWVVEWLEARTARQEKTEAKKEATAAKPVDEKAAQKRREQRDTRVREGLELLHQSLLDMTRDGLAASGPRDPETWENLARRMVDAQAPGLAGQLRFVADSVLRDPESETELAFEISRLFLLTKTALEVEDAAGPLKAEVAAQLGGRGAGDGQLSPEVIGDEWFVAGRRVEERDRLLTSMTLLYGQRSTKWARLLRFAPVPQTIAEPWPVGARVEVEMEFFPGLYPQRAQARGDGLAKLASPPEPQENALDSMLQRFADGLAANPFLRQIPFLIPLRPAEKNTMLADAFGRGLSWSAPKDMAIRVETVCGGHPTLMAGEFDGRSLRLLAILDGDAWISLTPKMP